MERLRSTGLVGTVIVKNIQRIRFFLTSAFPYQDAFALPHLRQAASSALELLCRYLAA